MKLFKLIMLLAGCTLLQTARADLVIVVHPSMNEMVTIDDISRVYTGRSSVLEPVNLADANPLRSVFDEKALGRTSSQIKAHWSKLVFTGKGTPPKEFASDDEVVNYVANNEFSIGYIDSSKVTTSVKVLHTIK
ncbi:phosphate ABC transporter substrate-binding protein [Arsukibacterium ikkense]|uniref:Phosphate ABC transporter substrate-binding protein n=1 Tax=Arsukibacterium ikkense TaxID=336831 RepID=A0A0M2V2W9_9GAMM|nr:phosphate ABC transporter substrate-binding protein [Arsukibacterium ikkense]KKO44986.1 phosphate ABC transporter substrate-binding protein [Arsukibacterium ikkense]